MTKPILSASTSTTANLPRSPMNKPVSNQRGRRRARKSKENSDVLISAVISTYLLTHLHHVLQRAEYGAEKEGRSLQAANFAQLRKVLCMDARSMEDASAVGMRENELEKISDPKFGSKVA